MPRLIHRDRRQCFAASASIAPMARPIAGMPLIQPAEPDQFPPGRPQPRPRSHQRRSVARTVAVARDGERRGWTAHDQALRHGRRSLLDQRPEFTLKRSFSSDRAEPGHHRAMPGRTMREGCRSRRPDIYRSRQIPASRPLRSRSILRDHRFCRLNSLRYLLVFVPDTMNTPSPR
jgi:hypothetical protein